MIGHATNQDLRVLVCDDEPRIRRALRVLLREAGYCVDTTRTAQEALDRAALCPPDAAIVELVLLDGDGVARCRRLCEATTVAVIVLSALEDDDEAVRALDAGADDYITKPFAPRELVARLGATLRRAARGDGEPRIEIRGLEIDLAARRMRRAGEEIRLTPIEFKPLRALVGHRGRLLTHHVLLGQVWGSDYVHGTATLRSHIANLRRKIEPAHGQRLIHTHHGAGYRFTGADREAAASWRAELVGLPSPLAARPHRSAGQARPASAASPGGLAA